MADKVLHEIRLIETDDGYRLEINGDKEKIREMGFGPGMMGFGHRKQFPGFPPHRPHGRRRHQRPRRRHGAWGCWHDEFDEPDIEEKSPEDIE